MSPTRRAFLKAAALCAVSSRVGAAGARETLHNGITLATPWPPRNRALADSPIEPPYIVDPPEVIPIDVGRQLFVDDFLIEERTLNRTFHHAQYHPASPVLRPAAEWERRDDAAERTHTRPNPAAMVFSDGVVFDPRDRMFKMWYMGGYSQNTCLALSTDGIDWHRPSLDVVPGTNIVRQELRDSNTIWLDAEADPAARFKMAAFNGSEKALMLATSADGIHWTAPRRSGPTGDRSTMFYNPFRRVWVFSLRNLEVAALTGRYRTYIESPSFPASWRADEPVLWIGADRLDPPRRQYASASQLYNLDCVAYESLVLGLFTIFRGEGSDREKPNDICVGFSRDGFHWSRPDRTPFIGVSEHVGDWNWANVQSAGGCCLVMDDRLFFYVSGRQGVPGTDLPGVCSTGLATLRRDGFASVNDETPADGPVRVYTSRARQLTTRPVRFSGSHLFVNAAATRGSVRAEVLDVAGRVIEPFSASHCRPIASADGTRLRVDWTNGHTLDHLRGEAVRFRFFVEGAHLYAFWVSRSERGASGGYLAAGAPGYARPIDA